MCNAPDDFILAEEEIELRVLSSLCSLLIQYITFLFYSFFLSLSVFHLLLNKLKRNTYLYRSPFASLILTQGHCNCLPSSHLISCLSLSLTHTHIHKNTHSPCHPHAFIYSLYFLIQFDE